MKRSDLPSQDFRSLRLPLTEATETLCAAIRLWPMAQVFHDEHDYWRACYGLLLNAHGSFRAVARLLDESQGPRMLPAQAGTITRSMLECLGNVLCLSEDRVRRTRLLVIDSYKERRKVLTSRQAYRGSSSHWAEFFASEQRDLDGLASVTFEPAERSVPEDSLPSWPYPRTMCDGKEPGIPKKQLAPGVAGLYARLVASGRAWLTGERKDVFTKLCDWSYGEYSRIAHSKDLAIALAIRAQEAPEVFLEETHRDEIVIGASLLLLCVLTEVASEGKKSASLASQGRWLPNENISKAWDLVNKSEVSAGQVYSIRYDRLAKG